MRVRRAREPCPDCGRLVGLTTPPHLTGQQQYPPKIHIHKGADGSRCTGSGKIVLFRVGGA